VNEDDCLRPYLIDALSDDNAAIKISAAKGVANLDGDDVTAAMVKELGKVAEVDTILIPLLEYRPGVFPLIVTALTGNEMKPSKEVIALMGRLASHVRFSDMPKEFLEGGDHLLTEAVKVVERAWTDADEETRATIVDTLFKLDGDEAIRVLDVIRNDPDPWLRIRVIELLMPLDDRRIPEFIARFLQDEDEMVRDVASSSLDSRGLTLGIAEAR
jgi:HEAT repeat protein